MGAAESSPSSPEASRDEGCNRSAVDDFGILADDNWDWDWDALRLRLAEPERDEEEDMKGSVWEPGR